MELIKFAGLLLFIVVSATSAVAGYADSTRALPTVGLVLFGNPNTSKPYQTAFRDGLRGLGHEEDKTVRIVTRYANGDAALLPALVNEMIVLEVDAMLVSHIALPVVLRATRTIPVVCATMSDPIGEESILLRADQIIR